MGRTGRPGDTSRLVATWPAASRLALPVARFATLPLMAGVVASSAMAQSVDPVRQAAESRPLIGLFFLIALAGVATATTLVHLASRKSWRKREAMLTQELTAARTDLHRANVFLAAEKQILIAWGGADEEADIAGDLSLISEIFTPRQVLAFGSWLTPEGAQALEQGVERLRSRGGGFRLPLTSLTGRHFEAEGLAVGGRAVLRIRDVSGDRLELTQLRESDKGVRAELETLRNLLDALPSPVWTRDAEGYLTWANAAYARAVEAASGEDAVARRIELLDSDDRAAAASTRASERLWRGRVHAVVAGRRNLMDVLDLACAGGSVGQATDLSELEGVRADLSRQMDAHTRTLDQLSTAVAIFDRGKRLAFHNAAYRHLWDLDQAFLDQNPTDSEILDRLRAERRLPEQADFRAWKAEMMGAYQSVETIEQVWYLPDSRTLRTVINPNPQGGVTYLFDDVTERFHLESRYNSLMRVQSETLDSLREGVAVFGSDGRLKLHNPAFQNLWSLPAGTLADEPHIDEIASACIKAFGAGADWEKLRGLVAGLHDERTGFQQRMLRLDGGAIDCAAAPLPDGATLLTFSDVSAAVNIQRALTERNKALVEAEKIRNDFVHHVSYELRSPLTNIIGFSQLLSDGTVGQLNQKQLEYSGYIMKSSGALLAIINDILDLASIDTDALELDLSEVDIRRTIEAAAQGLQDRLSESSIHLQIVAMDNVGTFRADAKRLRQVLFNLLSNAIGFSTPGQTVTLAAMRRGDAIVFKVTDQGRGIPAEVLGQVFDRFRTHTIGSRHKGVGLGLSIVRAFVELHGGEVQIQSAPGEGTTVTCIFPETGIARNRSAEVA